MSGCQFPLWKDGERPDHTYCQRIRQPGSSYCVEHHARCFERPKPTAGALGYFSSLHQHAGTPYGGQDMGPLKALSRA